MKSVWCLNKICQYFVEFAAQCIPASSRSHTGRVGRHFPTDRRANLGLRPHLSPHMVAAWSGQEWVLLKSTVQSPPSRPCILLGSWAAKPLPASALIPPVESCSGDLTKRWWASFEVLNSLAILGPWAEGGGRGGGAELTFVPASSLLPTLSSQK